MGYAAVGNCGAAGQIGHVLDVSRAHDASIVDRDVGKKPIKVHILLSMCIDEIMKVVTGDREHRLSVQFGIIEAIQKMNAARPGSRNAGAESAGVLGISTGHERGGFFVAHVNEANFFFLLAQRFHDAVDAVAGKAEYNVHTPISNGIDQDFRRICCHGYPLVFV